MSLLDDASLIITPNAYKTSKLYSIKPTDGSGDLSVVRATTATRVNSDGLIELVPYNLLNYSEQFDNAFWVKSGTTIIANDTISPDGNTTADRVTRGASGNGTIEKSFSTTNSTFSVFAKKGNSNLISLFALGSSHRADFNLDLGTIISSSGTGVSPKIENYGNGWFRCILENVPSVTQVRIYAGGVGTAVENDYNYIWGAQLVQGSEAKEYLRTETGLNIPRLDYSNGCPSILVEPQRTNLITNSLGYSSGSNYTITTNNLSLDGSNNAILATEKTTPGTYIINSVSATILPSTTYTYSFFVKSNGITTLPINASDGVVGNISYVNIITGQVISGSATVTNYNNGWFRISVTRTTSATASSGFMQCNFGAKTGDGVSGFYLYGFQIEAGSNATSYIPTTSASVTRNADVISKTGISDLINSREGVLFANIKALSNPSTTLSGFSLGLGANRISFRFSSTANQINAIIVTNSVQQVYSNYNSFNNYASEFNKIALKYKDNDVSLYINGVKVLEDLSCTMPNVNSISDLLFSDGGISASANSFFGNVNLLAVFPTVLSDAELIDLTTI